MVLEAAGPEVAKEFHDLLFEDQPAEDDPDSHCTDDELVDLAVEAGATEADVRDGIEDLAYEDWVDDATEAAVDANVEGTPTIVLDGEPFADGGSSVGDRREPGRGRRVSRLRDGFRVDRGLPKAELHVHHVGSASPRMVSELAARHPGTVPSDLEELRAFFEFRDFAHFIEVYLAVVDLVKTPEDIRLPHLRGRPRAAPRHSRSATRS